MRRMSNRSGFTLIELLVVIAIIAILAAILFPVFARAKKAAHAKACYGNIKTFGHAMLLYADDWAGALPPCVQREYVSEAPDYPSARTGRKVLWPYIRSKAAYRCPAMERDALTWGGVDERKDIPGSYGINQEVTSNDSDYQGRHIRTVSQYPRASKIIACGEIKSGMWTCDFKIALRQNIPALAAFYHFGKMNVGFVDGHVQSVYLYDTLGTNPREWMWWDPQVNTDCGDPTYWQTKFRKEWPRQYPPFGDSL